VGFERLFTSPGIRAKSGTMLRARLLAEKTTEIERLAELAIAEVRPSLRDFAQFVATQKSAIALVPRLKRADPGTGGRWPDLDMANVARACDDADVGAIAVGTAALMGGAIEDLRTVAEAVTAPVLRDDLCLHANQIYQARLYGADAVRLPAADLDRESLGALVAVVESLHMAAIIEVRGEADIETALDLAPACIGLDLPANDGFADLEAARVLAARIPSQRVVLLLDEVRGLKELLRLKGLVDAAVVGDALLDAPDAAAAIEAFASLQER
jgi:indole-3-glycerol phosphate synthase